MEFEILWSPEALDDLRPLTNFIAVDNPAAAEKIGRALISSTEVLTTQPLLGRRVPEQQSNNTFEKSFARRIESFTKFEEAAEPLKY